MALSQFIKDHALLSIVIASFVSALAAAALATIGLYYFTSFAIPDIRSGLQDLTSEIRANRNDFRADSDRQLASLNRHVAEEKTARDRQDSTIRVLQSTMIAVMQKVEKRPLKSGEINQILSGVTEVSTVAAASLLAPTVVSGPTVPQVSNPVEHWIAGIYTSRELPSQSIAILSATDMHGVSGFLARGMLAKNGVWEATESSIGFKYAGGSATIAAKEGVSPAVLKDYAETLNSMSRAVAQTVEQDARYRPQGQSSPNYRKREQLTPMPSGPIPETRAPELQIK
jgi:hypothetical protein